MRVVASAFVIALVTITGSSLAQVPDAYLHDSYYVVPSAPSVAVAVATVGIPPLAVGEVLLEVDGEGLVRTPADVVMLSVPVVTNAKSAVEARVANTQLERRLSAAARSVGVADADIRLVDPTERLGFVGNEMANPMIDAGLAVEANQVVRQILEIRIRTPSDYPRLRDALERAGAKQVGPPDYSLSDSNAARQGAKAKAIANARMDAESYARALNMRVARILRVSDRASINPYDATNYRELFRKMSGVGNAPANQVETSARVAIDFALVPNR